MATQGPILLKKSEWHLNEIPRPCQYAAAERIGGETGDFLFYLPSGFIGDMVADFE
jgi:hypothetical protein